MMDMHGARRKQPIFKMILDCRSNNQVVLYILNAQMSYVTIYAGMEVYLIAKSGLDLL